MTTKTKMPTDLFGAMLVLKASINVLEEKLVSEDQWPIQYTELGYLCDSLKVELRSILDSEWWWG